jgi:hypothetical protein
MNDELKALYDRIIRTSTRAVVGSSVSQRVISDENDSEEISTGTLTPSERYVQVTHESVD